MHACVSACVCVLTSITSGTAPLPSVGIQPMPEHPQPVALLDGSENGARVEAAPSVQSVLICAELIHVLIIFTFCAMNIIISQPAKWMPRLLGRKFIPSVAAVALRVISLWSKTYKAISDYSMDDLHFLKFAVDGTLCSSFSDNVSFELERDPLRGPTWS